MEADPNGPDARAKAVCAAWTADGGYVDPLSDVSGYDRIAAMIAAAHEQFPGFVFPLAGGVDGHHDTARFSWELVSEARRLGSVRRIRRDHARRAGPDQGRAVSWTGCRRARDMA